MSRQPYAKDIPTPAGAETSNPEVASTTGNLPPDGGDISIPDALLEEPEAATTPRIVPPPLSRIQTGASAASANTPQYRHTASDERNESFETSNIRESQPELENTQPPISSNQRFGHGRGVEGPQHPHPPQHRLETHGQQSSAAQRSGAEQYAMNPAGTPVMPIRPAQQPAMFQTQPTAYKNPLFARWIEQQSQFFGQPNSPDPSQREQPREPPSSIFQGNPEYKLPAIDAARHYYPILGPDAQPIRYQMYGTANRDLPTNDGAAYQKALPSVPEVLRNLNREEQPNPWGALDTRYLPDPTRSTRSDLKRKRNLSNNGESDKRLSERELFRHNLESHRRLNNTIQPRQDNRMPFLNAPFAPHPVAGNPGSIAFLNPQENEYPVPWNFRQDADNSALDYDERPRYHNRAPSGNPRPRRRARRQDPSSNEALHDFPNDQQHQSLGTESVANINPKIDHQIAQNIAAMDRRLDNVFGQPAQNSSADTFTEPARARPYWTIFDDVAEARRRDQRIRDNLKRFEDDYGSPGPPPSACGSDGHFESRQPLPVREVHRPPPRLPHMRLPSLSPNSRSHVIPATTASLPLG
ncbi:hypothetical protein BZA77DRAFT_357631 [Pyronema omphalodes]|nr:hypothetical protein BZA77DRAFT_357631 [Pyronema omphalodes]